MLCTKRLDAWMCKLIVYIVKYISSFSQGLLNNCLLSSKYEEFKHLCDSLFGDTASTVIIE